MKKLPKGTALLFAVLLASIMLFSSCDTSFDLGDATQIDKELTIEEGGNISLSTVSSNISVGVSPDDKVHLTYYVYERVTYTVIESDSEFSIKQQIGVNNSGKIEDMTVLVPKDLILGTFFTFATSGDINITGVSASSVDVSATSGNILLNELSAKENVSLRATSGDINITGVSANSVDVSATSGNILLNELSAKGNVSLKATSGSMQFTKLSADVNIDISVFSANVSGRIVGSQGDFTVTTEIDDSRGDGTGTINVDAGGTGSKQLNLKTEKGNINISFTE